MTKKEIWIKINKDGATAKIAAIESVERLVTTGYQGDYSVIVLSEIDKAYCKLTQRLNKDAIVKLVDEYGADNIRVIEEHATEPVKNDAEDDKTNVYLKRIAQALEGIERKMKDESYSNK